MAGNPNYRAGRSWEYKVKREYEDNGYDVVRTAGSHGKFDLIAVDTKEDDQVIFIQCKRCATEAQANRLMDDFEENPPLRPSEKYWQFMEVYVKQGRKRLTRVA